ncbi:MAG: M12 family metallopeptidase [bacterium]
MANDCLRPHLFPASAALAGLVFCLVIPAWGPSAQGAQPTLKHVQGIPEGYELVEGDILLPIDRKEKYLPTLWPGGIVYFQFDDNMSTLNQEQALAAMDTWMACGAGLSFVPRLNEPNYIHFRDSVENSSMVGMVTGEQFINIYNWNWHFIICHEICHALGFWHEHSRPDRDDFIEVIIANIPSVSLHNFSIRDEWVTLQTPYDFDSVMHYSQCSFSLCGECPDHLTCGSYPYDGRTLLCRAGHESWQEVIGQREHLSFYDVVDMVDAYGPGQTVFVDPLADPAGADGTLSRPFLGLADGLAALDPGGRLFLRGGYYYATSGSLTEPMSWHAYLGSAVLTD